MWKFLQEVGQDLGVACRKLRANTGLTIAVLLTLMIGTGANAAIFSVVYHVLVKPLPYQHPDRLVCLQGDRRGRPGIHPLSFPDFREIQDQAVFDLLASVTHRTATFIGGTRPVRISAGVVSHSFTSVLGVQPIMGRLFSEFDSHPSNPAVALLSYSLWQNSFVPTSMSSIGPSS